jgi:hypothetical protein
MFPHLSYTASLDQSQLSTLHERREKQCLSLYKSVLNHDNKFWSFLILLTIKIILGTLESIRFLNVEQNVLRTVLAHIVSKMGFNWDDPLKLMCLI